MQKSMKFIRVVITLLAAASLFPPLTQFAYSANESGQIKVIVESDDEGRIVRGG